MTRSAGVVEQSSSDAVPESIESHCMCTNTFIAHRSITLHSPPPTARQLCKPHKGLPRIFHWEQDRRAENRGRRPRAGGGVLGRGQQAPSPPARRSGERCKIPQRGSRRSPDSPKVFHNFQHPGWPLLTSVLKITGNNHRR